MRMIPALMIILAQMEHGKLVQNSVCVFDGDTMVRRLDDGILLGMDTTAKLMAFTEGTPILSRRHPTSSQ